MTEENLNDISLVYDNDTVDFGTIHVSSPTPSETANAKKDDVTHIESESDSESDTGEEGHLPQHFENNNNTDFYQQHSSTIIDNRTLEYIPVRLACGISAYCSPDVLKHCPMVLRSIQADISKAFRILPVSVHSLLRRTNLWLNYNGYAYGPKANPQILRHITTHHHPAWLVEWACDTPQKAMGIEIYSCVDYQTMRLHWNGSGLLLHEFCHLIHQCCLDDGLENKTVQSLHQRADASGNYERVLRRDWAGKTQTGQPADFDLAYAMVDAKEFFAEMSVAFFCTFYKSLDKADPNRMEACSPPLLHPDATKRIRSLVKQRERDSAPSHLPQNQYYRFLGGNDYRPVGEDNLKQGMDCWAPFPPLERFVKNIQRQTRTFLSSSSSMDQQEDLQLAQWRRLVDPVIRETAANGNGVGHCNKFFPFTRGQLKRHDPELFQDLCDLWNEISQWEDPFASIRTKRRMARRCFFFSDCC